MRRVAFLVDVDNTLLDHDAVQRDMKRRLDREVGVRRRRAYWRMVEELRAELGYVDYLGALQRYRRRFPHDAHLLPVSSFLLNYPFERRLYPKALDVVRRLRRLGPTFIVTDGDVVFQPRKIERAGIAKAVGGRVLLYIHKERELRDIRKRCPAPHYVLIDDKPRIVAAFKKAWKGRVTTVLPRQGHYALAPENAKDAKRADVTLARIGDLLAPGALKRLAAVRPWT